MKVYYNIEGIPEFTIKGVLGNSEIEDSIDKSINRIIERSNADISLKWKYRIMWELRSLESEINEENGIIIIESTKWHTKGFTPELTEKIMAILSEVDETNW